MSVLTERLRRMERTLRIGDLDAELERMPDEELEARIHALQQILEAQPVTEEINAMVGTNQFFQDRRPIKGEEAP